MPITSSAKKALRQNLRHRTRNLARAAAYKRAVKAYAKFAQAGGAEAPAALAAAYQALDKAAKSGVIKTQKASRLKSRLTRRYSAKSSRASS